jgi:hypothetical protein
VLDWDDTLFPTTWIRSDLQLNWQKTIAEQLRSAAERSTIEKHLKGLERQVEAFLRLASELTTVFIVTLARKPWVEVSSRNFMPMFDSLLKELDIKVIYARDFIDAKTEQDYNAAEFVSSDSEIEFWTKAKARAMEDYITTFYKQSNSSWKNIMSFGDSEIERLALKSLSRRHMVELAKDGQMVTEGLTAEVVKRDGYFQTLRTKTLKMLDDPSVEELIAEINLASRWLPYLVKNECGIDVAIEGSDDNEELSRLNAAVTGLDEDLRWTDLAGITVSQRPSKCSHEGGL